MDKLLQTHLSLMSRYFRQLRKAYLAVFLCGLVGQGANADIFYGPSEMVQLVSENLAEGRKPMYDQLATLGFDAEVEALQKQTADGLKHLPAQAVIEHLYYRAEASSVGEGERFIGILLRDQVARSGALANDEVISSYLDRFTTAQLDLARSPISFASVSSTSNVPTAPMPQAVEQGVKKLSEIYAHQGLAQLRVAALRTMRKPGFDTRAFDRAVLESPNRETAVRRIIASGTPQPPVETALRQLLGEAVGRNAALGLDPSTMRIMEELSRDLPQEQRRYVTVETQLESRKAQMEQARSPETPTVVSRSSREAVIEAMQPRPTGQVISDFRNFSAVASSEVQKESYEKYINDTFEPPAPPEGPSADLPPPRSESGPKTKRNFTSARFSARAGRGVSVGGELRSEIEETPVRAVWLSNVEDSRFGRLFIIFQRSPNGTPQVAASRILFADSFFSAHSSLSTSNDQPSTYREGEILVLMSMDNEGVVTQEIARTLSEKKQKIILAAINRLTAEDRVKFLSDYTAMNPYFSIHAPDHNYQIRTSGLMDELLSKGMDRLPAEFHLREMILEMHGLTNMRGVVTNPALHGRELAWSAIRIDFWSNQISMLEKESMRMNGGKSLPVKLKAIKDGGGETWQYYERDSVIRMRETMGSAHEIFVISSPTLGESASERSHFSVAMFHREQGDVGIKAEDNFFRRPDLEERLQPLLDWLATNHHDYMRLNDFSEAFSLLRWLRSENVDLAIMEAGGHAGFIETPDRVHIGSGPELAPHSETIDY